uniref:Intraflagellar transport protein 56 n=1 Tax=Cyprinodon variegatus TaxID=28743 RepID=A0A3Q2E219_CYPVA
MFCFFFSFQILSRVKPAVGAETEGSIGEKKKKQTVPSLEEYLQQRDYLGGGDVIPINTPITKNVPPLFPVAPMSPLQNRLLFHLAHKFNDEKRLMRFHQNLEDVTEDQLSLASIHYMRSHYQEAIDIYKRLLLQNRSLLFPSRHSECSFTDPPYKSVTAELKNLIDISSCSSEFAKEVIQHNLVSFPLSLAVSAEDCTDAGSGAHSSPLCCAAGGVPRWGGGAAGAASFDRCDS